MEKKITRRKTPFPGKLLAVDVEEEVDVVQQEKPVVERQQNNDKEMKRRDTPFQMAVSQGSVSSQSAMIGLAEEEEGKEEEEAKLETVNEMGDIRLITVRIGL